MRARKLLGLGSAATLVFVTACGGGAPAPEAPAGSAAPPAAAGRTVDPATAGTVTGRIVLEGTPPPNEVIRMNADPVCVREVKGTQYTETFLVGEGGALGNVFVYVRDGLGNYTFPVPGEAVVLDQQGCRYHPHVFGVQIGQTLQILNSDPTLHNVHAIPKNNQEFNTGQPVKGMKMDHKFTAREVMVPFKCDVHGWMNAYAGVLDHPYYAVTGDGGTFELKGLPPGDYVVEAWHEKLGAQTQNVTLGERETKEISFTFKL
jgi:plastocyanin